MSQLTDDMLKRIRILEAKLEQLARKSKLGFIGDSEDEDFLTVDLDDDEA